MSYSPKRQNQRFRPFILVLIGMALALGLAGLIEWQLSIFRPGGAGAMLSTSTFVPNVVPSVIVGDNLMVEKDTFPTLPATATPNLVVTVVPASLTPTHTATVSPTPTHTGTPTATPTPTRNLNSCNAAGCGPAAAPLPTAELNDDLFLIETTPQRRLCLECPPNEHLPESVLDALVAADPATLARLRQLVLSQETYQIAPGIVYIMYNNVHHVVIDLKEKGFILRNIIPNSVKRGTLITPSYCLSDKSLIVTTGDYHGLNGSNKTETGRDIFFHLGRAALYERNGRYNIDVIRTRPAYNRTSVSWGGGPIFIWDGRYDYNPETEWFDAENLEHYRSTRWAKLTVAISKERRYLFLSLSYALTLKEHAQNIIELGQKWGIYVDRAMRFDGSESAYIAIRLGNYMVPILKLEEPLIVNCFAVEKR
jgi:hypothetical protein